MEHFVCQIHVFVGKSRFVVNQVGPFQPFRLFREHHRIGAVSRRLACFEPDDTVSETVDAMLQREGPHFTVPQFNDPFRHFHRQRDVMDLILDALAEVGQEETQDRTEVPGRIDVKRGGAPVERHG